MPSPGGGCGRVGGEVVQLAGVSSLQGRREPAAAVVAVHCLLGRVEAAEFFSAPGAQLAEEAEEVTGRCAVRLEGERREGEAVRRAQPALSGSGCEVDLEPRKLARVGGVGGSTVNVVF